MIDRNQQMARLKQGYLFPEIKRRSLAFLEKEPGADLISLGVGDTTEPIPPSITKALVEAAARMGTREGYVGYGYEPGMEALRQQIADTFYKGHFQANEIFISDGAKCDLGRLQALFGREVSIALQDPTYPVYLEGSIIQGVEKIHFMPCSLENHFVPDIEKAPRTDLIYICSPNNPTGSVLTREELTRIVEIARARRSLIIFDAAYASYIRDPLLPKSIFEIPGAREVAIEVGSFSKLVGFTGIRLGWTVVPEALKYASGESIRTDWQRIITTIFNGSSIIAQWGGLAALQPQGLLEIEQLVNFYLENSRILKKSLEARGYTVFGGVHAPYLWVPFSEHTSWDMFQKILERSHLITIPGSGFGSAGEGFIRFSAYGGRENILEAAARLSRF